MNSRSKGKRGERQFRDVLREHGFCKARRGQQYAGGNQSPDVVCEELPGIHWEVKFTERNNLYDWMTQAIGDAGSGLPIVAHRRKNSEWLAVLRMDDLINIIKQSDMISPPENGGAA